MNIVLVGGGHANALALLTLGKRCRTTLVSEYDNTPYSGMLPGYIAGRYRKEECFIDLQQLADNHQADLIVGRAGGIVNNELLLEDGRRIPFDLLAINAGAVPAPPFAATDACAVKPIGAFIRYLDNLIPHRNMRIGVVGGGAGGVETVLALAERFRQYQPLLSLVTDVFLPDFPQKMRQRLRQRLTACGIAIVEKAAIGYANGELTLTGGERQPLDHLIFAIQVSAPAWLKNTPLTLADDGFIRINPYLQSINNPAIFAVGDIAAPPALIPKSGVMAVRQSPLLSHNLSIASGLKQGTLKRWDSNKAALYIISTGDGKAFACRNGFTVGGRWVWRWKYYLDKKFMQRFP